MILPDPTLDLPAQIEALRVQYIASLATKASQFKDCWECIDNPRDTAAVQELLRQAHSLAGSAGSFGLTELGQLAHSVETSLKQLLHEPKSSIPVPQPLPDKLIQQLIDALNQAGQAST